MAAAGHRRRTAPPLPAPERRWTSRRRRCGASSIARCAPTRSDAAGARGSVGRWPDRTLSAPRPAPATAPWHRAPHAAIPTDRCSPTPAPAWAQSPAPACRPRWQSACAGLRGGARSRSTRAATPSRRAVRSGGPPPEYCRRRCPARTGRGTTGAAARTTAACPLCARPAPGPLRSGRAVPIPCAPAGRRPSVLRTPRAAAVRFRMRHGFATPAASPAANGRPVRRSCRARPLCRAGAHRPRCRP
ncbi:hypothetical protein DUGA2_64920 [Duganella sp. HH101]|nr:hypothetical protein DUGA2_64920 [Duganella sp. HH101]